MAGILAKILEAKRAEVLERRARVSDHEIAQLAAAAPPPRGFERA